MERSTVEAEHPACRAAAVKLSRKWRRAASACRRGGHSASPDMPTIRRRAPSRRRAGAARLVRREHFADGGEVTGDDRDLERHRLEQACCRALPIVTGTRRHRRRRGGRRRRRGSRARSRSTPHRRAARSARATARSAPGRPARGPSGRATASWSCVVASTRTSWPFCHSSRPIASTTGASSVDAEALAGLLAAGRGATTEHRRVPTSGTTSMRPRGNAQPGAMTSATCAVIAWNRTARRAVSASVACAARSFHDAMPGVVACVSP